MFKLPFLKAKYLQPRFLMVIFLVIIVGFSFAGVANAAISDAVATFLGWIVYGIVYALGWILTLVMQGLVWLAQWNNFIDAPAVVLGWKIVRDICNMFFVVIMLIIAFATILRVKDYTYEKLLPKLIIMAILINFSKMICGLLIDVSQVVMLTFVNSFKDVGGENLTKILGLDTLTSMKEGGAEEANITAWSIMGSYVLALVYVIVALITIITMMIMLAVRIVMIWIYVVLSPLAYLLGSFPAGKRYSSKWWHDFTRNLIVGPMLAFFIWLSFAALGTGQDSVGSSGISADKPSAKGISSDGSNSITQAGSPDNMLNFVISIAMLYGGLTIAKSVGGAAGDMAGKGMGAISKGKGMAISGIKSGARSTAYGAIANKRMAPITKNVLGTVAATGGVRGKILGAVGVRGLAGKGLIAFNQQQKKVEDKAQKKIESFKDTRIVERYAREKAFTPLGIAAQKKASNMMPSALYNPGNPASVGKVEKKLAGMGKDDLAKMSDAEWYAIGRTGAKLNSRALSYIQKNSEERGAYNLGQESLHPGALAGALAGATGHGLVAGTDKHGNRMTTGQIFGVYAHQKARGTLDADVQSTLERSGSHSTQYFREENSKPKTLEPEKETRVSEEDQESPRGKGNLSVNEIARGTSSTVAVDFDKLNLPEINKGNDADYRNTRGFNTSDQDLVGKIASKMLEVISQEKDQLLSKKSLEPGDQKRLASLNKAEEYFKAPEKIDNLSMLNSSAAKFKVSDAKETKVHEEIHGLGYGEDDTRSVTGSIMKNKNYSARHNRGEIDSILTENNQQSGVAKKSSQEVEQEQDEAELELDKSPKIGDATVDTNELNKAIENFSQKISEVAKTFSAVGQSKSVSSNSMNSTRIGGDNFSLFRNLGKIIKSSNNDIANKISILGGTKAQSPLELDVIYKEIDSEK